MPSSSEKQTIFDEELHKDQSLANLPVLDNHASAVNQITGQQVEIEIFDEDNPGPTFEEVFPEYAYQDYESPEYEDENLCEYYYEESEGCECCKGFVYNCDGKFCLIFGTCECVGDKELPQHYFTKS
jgi:hypothetical protein